LARDDIPQGGRVADDQRRAALTIIAFAVMALVAAARASAARWQRPQFRTGLGREPLVGGVV